MDGMFFQQAVSHLGTAVSIVKSLNQIKATFEFQGKLSELQTAMIEAQQCVLSGQAAQADLIEEKRILKEEIARLTDWSAEKQRYQLVRVWGGTVIAYAIKESMSRDEPPHLLCANCCHEGKKSILQQTYRTIEKHRSVLFHCGQCGLEIDGTLTVAAPVFYAEHYSDRMAKEFAERKQPQKVDPE